VLCEGVIGGAPDRASRDYCEKKGAYRMKTLFALLWRDEQGQDLIEYTLMLAFVALASAALFSSAGTSINQIWSKTNSQLSTAAGS
jgi:Flp pilus assembly pilin Flp